MIQISPPAVMPYAPAVQPIAFVDVLVQRDEATARIYLGFTLFDANKNRINVAPGVIPAVTQPQYDAFVALAATAGDTIDQDISRRALPVVATNFGLTGTVMAPGAPSPATKKPAAPASKKA